MSVVFSAANQALTRTTGLFAAGSFTMCCWFKLTSIVGGTSCVLCIRDNTAGSVSLESDGTGVMQIGFQDKQVNISAALTAGKWYFLAVVQSGNTNYAGYISPAGGGQLVLTSTTDATALVTFTNFTVGDEVTGGSAFPGEAQAVKLWSAALTQQDLENEQFSQMFVRSANLNAFYQFLTVTNDTKDLSGNGNNLTAGAGTPATGIGPPASWVF